MRRRVVSATRLFAARVSCIQTSACCTPAVILTIPADRPVLVTPRTRFFLGDVIVSSLFTLVLIPIGFSLVIDAEAILRRRRGRTSLCEEAVAYLPAVPPNPTLCSKFPRRGSYSGKRQFF